MPGWHYYNDARKINTTCFLAYSNTMEEHYFEHGVETETIGHYFRKQTCSFSYLSSRSCYMTTSDQQVLLWIDIQCCQRQNLFWSFFMKTGHVWLLTPTTTFAYKRSSEFKWLFWADTHARTRCHKHNLLLITSLFYSLSCKFLVLSASIHL